MTGDPRRAANATAQTNAISKIVIVGGGTSGWLAAAMLAHNFDPDVCELELIESEEISTIGVGESVVAPFVGLLRRLGIDEAEWMRATDATYKLGIQFVGWSRPHAKYFHPFGTIGQPIDDYDFYQCWLKACAAGASFALQDFSPCSVMAQQGRFFPPQHARGTPIGGASYAYHLDATLMGRFLRHFAEARGLTRTEGRVVEVKRREDGFIETLVLADGREIRGDFFIDSTGFSALLIERALGAKFIDWSGYLPCDRAIALKTDSKGTSPPFTRASAQGHGWSWRTPLRQRTSYGYVFASAFCSDATARSTLVRSVNGAVSEEPRVIHFKAGHHETFWKHNCLALGLAAGFLEPLESTAIHLMARSMQLFLECFPDRHCHAALAAEYNRRMLADYEEVRDFVMLHYCTTNRDDSEFWRHCRNVTHPDSLQARLELFREKGVVPRTSDCLFPNSSWQSIFDGMGVVPRSHCRRVDNLELDAIVAALHRAKNAIHGMVSHLPLHEEFLSASLTPTAPR
ncbi:MAG TPA: tryptophan halogenase family protein [Steroidobacteraceae bacterium]|nr:tryptophan halogenase family protein [Steroidobacteraceae bacterium]